MRPRDGHGRFLGLPCAERIGPRAGCSCEHCRAYWRRRKQHQASLSQTQRGTRRKEYGRGARADIIMRLRGAA